MNPIPPTKRIRIQTKRCKNCSNNKNVLDPIKSFGNNTHRDNIIVFRNDRIVFPITIRVTIETRPLSPTTRTKSKDPTAITQTTTLNLVLSLLLVVVVAGARAQLGRPTAKTRRDHARCRVRANPQPLPWHPSNLSNSHPSLDDGDWF